MIIHTKAELNSLASSLEEGTLVSVMLHDGQYSYDLEYEMEIEDVYEWLLDQGLNFRKTNIDVILLE